MKCNFLKQRGFTLVELILYVALTSLILFSVSTFLSSTMESRVKNQTIAEINQQGIQVMQIITQAIRNADSIISPGIGTQAGSLTLGTYTPSLNPTLFDVASDAIRIEEGTGATLLTNNRVIASGFTVKNLSRAITPGTIQIQFTLSYLNTVGRNEFNYSKTFTGSATLRHP